MNISEQIITGYQRQGDKHPPKAALGSVLNFAGAENAPQDPKLWLVAAHACIDFARHASANDRILPSVHIRSHHEKATAFFDRIVDLAKEQSRAGDNSGYRTTAPYAIAATLQKSELRTWHSHGKGNIAGNNYNGLLHASREALQYMIPGEERTSSRLRSFMPVLLGARSNHRDYTKGWFGRTALLREEWRYGYNGINQSVNWNAGLCFPDLEHTFAEPLRVKVTRDAYGSRDAARRAGVVAVSAIDCSISEPERIILSCLNEFEPTPIPDGVQAYSTDQLDAIAGITEQLIRREAYNTTAPSVQ
jgi:hypothetical protein